MTENYGDFGGNLNLGNLNKMNLIADSVSEDLYNNSVNNNQYKNNNPDSIENLNNRKKNFLKIKQPMKIIKSTNYLRIDYKNLKNYT